LTKIINEIWKGKQITHSALLAALFTREAKVAAMKK
jgi:hypothetical protein